MNLHEVRQGMRVNVTLTPNKCEVGTVKKIGTKGAPHVRSPLADAVLVVCASHPDGVWVQARQIREARVKGEANHAP